MPRFFFHIRAGGHADRLDREGGDYDHVGAAERDLIVTLRSLVQDGRLSPDEVAHWVVHVTDGDGVVHAKVPVAAVIRDDR